MDAETLQAVADYAASVRESETGTRERLRNAVWNYRRSLTGQAALRTYGESLSSQPEKPYRGIVCSLYLLALAAGLGRLVCAVRGRKGRRRALFELAVPVVVFGIRSGLLLYLYYNQRPVARLTHSVYLCESVILLWLLLKHPREAAEACEDLSRPADGSRRAGSPNNESAKEVSGRRITILGHGAVPAALAVVMIWGISCQWKVVDMEEDNRTANNTAYEQLQEYAGAHEENVYLLDVYSTVGFSDPVGSAGNVPVNLELLGGWACKSPLDREKLQNLGLDIRTEFSSGTGLFDNLLRKDSVFVAAETGSDMAWLADFYASKGVQVQVIRADVIGESWEIYTVQES